MKVDRKGHLALQCLRVLIHLVSVPWWGLLDPPGKTSSLQKSFRVGPESRFFTGEPRKPARDDMKV